MAIYEFRGRALPERDRVTLNPSLALEAHVKEAGLDFEVTMSIRESEILVQVKTHENRADLETLRNYVRDLARVVVDTGGYLLGRGYDVEIDSVIQPDGTKVEFGVGIAVLESTQHERPLAFNETLSLVLTSEHLRRAIGDLREAVRSPVDTGFFCYRAVESLRQHFRKEEDGEKQGPSWERMGNALRIDRGWVDELVKTAQQQRHGETPYMSGESRVTALMRAWKIVDRFVSYASKGFVPLPEGEFEVLRLLSRENAAQS